MIRVGAKVPNSGPLPAELGLTTMARRLEEVGFASLWLSDHIVQPETFTSHYPFAADGKATWPTDDPWYDAIVSMAMIAAVTERVEIGVAVLVLPLRHPVELAKQIATIDALSRGRTALGVGVGWQAEEFEALGVPFDDRGRRTDEWLALLRACWTGRPAATSGGLYELPADVLCYPTPARRPPLLIGGMSPVAFRRSAAADGWLALQPAAGLDLEPLAAGVAAVRDRGGGAVEAAVRAAHHPVGGPGARGGHSAPRAGGHRLHRRHRRCRLAAAGRARAGRRRAPGGEGPPGTRRVRRI